MKELIQHIEKLLLSNDCVIIPDFGGFVAHYSSAAWIDEENSYFPPTRVIGFNSHLKLNDGLLTQDYMDTYSTDFADASKMVLKAVDELKYFLHLNGYLDIHGLGEMTQTIDNQYTFKPYNDGIMTPSLYALSPFQMNYLYDSKPQQVNVLPYTVPVTTENDDEAEINEEYEDNNELIHTRRKLVYMFSAIAVAAAVLIFFLFPVKIKNTEISKVNVAQLIPVNAFGGSSSSTSSVKSPKQNVIVNSTNIKQNTVNDNYFIIVCALSKESNADKFVKSLQKQGNNKSIVIHKRRKYCIAITSYNNQDSAYSNLEKYRGSTQYKDAWLLIK